MQKKLRIAQIVTLEADVPPKSQNGLEFIASWLTEGLVKKGHDVTLFATDESVTSGTLKSLLPKELCFGGRAQWFQPTRSTWNTTYAASMASEFDIMHSHTGTIVFSMPFIDIPVIQTLHHPFSNEILNPKFSSPGYAKQMKFIFDQYAKIHYVTVSANQSKGYLKAKKAYFKNYTVIQNGIPVSDFAFSKSSGDYFLYIGYINEKKGAHIAVKAAHDLGLKLIIAGNNYGETAFFEKHIRPYLSQKITYIGPVSFKEKIALYAQAKALLAPIQWDEPYGLTLAEAQACGTPVISYNKGASREIIKHKKTGFISTSYSDFLKNIQNIENIDRHACRKHAEKNLDTQRMIDEYEKLYYSLTHPRVSTS